MMDCGNDGLNKDKHHRFNVEKKKMEKNTHQTHPSQFIHNKIEPYCTV